jgi:L-asparagine transporter-like permease
MEKHNFEYFNQKFVNKLVPTLLALFLLLFFGSIILLSNNSAKNSLFVVFFCFIVSFSIPYAIYRLKRKEIKKEGSASIYELYIEFDLDKTQRRIAYADIKSYLIQSYNGTLLNLVLKDGEKFNIAANNTYCDTIKFDNFCADLEHVLEKFNESNNSSVIRKKTFFEKAWLLPFLVILTSAFAFMIIHSFATGKKLPVSSLLMALGPLLTLWGGYFVSRNRRMN